MQNLFEQNDFTFAKCIAYLNERGNALYGKHFHIRKADYETVFKLVVWAIGDYDNAQRFKINLNKGILLTGPVGSGKTSLMTLLNCVAIPSRKFLMKSARETSFEFIQNGYKTIQNYSNQSYTLKSGEISPKHYCFDDLGTENNIKFYGNECNVLGEILLSRYDHFVSRRMFTHITTNLSASEIEEMYGKRVRSRLREMLNLISFDHSTPDKRN